ncbi:DUF6804 family protein [Crenobacter cavernae]|uniref:Uncharacterized protein n=1 Tax=Crenobacter cavernae TaxID=2290923 RepID=A0ABY0FE36_9NEIS|nr:DUF6804 family protein [Crenobacter cavernae]RXZ44258.1 hypothetical protein EBB06_06900 [Crenobacter cavernae]
MPAAVIYVCAAMLFVGAAPLPYGYYMLLRLVVCGVFAFAAFVAFDRKSKVLPWVYGFMALVFNPFVKIHFPKEMWAVVDVAAGVLLVATAKAVKTN